MRSAIPTRHAQFRELRAGFADSRTIRTPEIGNGLVVAHQLAGRPHEFAIPSGLARIADGTGSASDSRRWQQIMRRAFERIEAQLLLQLADLR